MRNSHSRARARRKRVRQRERIRERRFVEELEREAAVRAMATHQTEEQRAVEALNQTVAATFDGLFSRDVM